MIFSGKFIRLGMGILISMVMVGCSTNKSGPGQGTKFFEGTNPFEESEKIDLESLKTSHPSRFKIFFSGNITGETEPCGCAVNPKGGLDRRLNYIRQATQATPFPYAILDAGNALFPNEKIDRSQEKHQKERARLIMEGHRMMSVIAQNVGYLDLSAGVDFLKNAASDAKVTLLSSNWIGADGKLLFEPQITFDLGREKAYILGFSKGYKKVPLKKDTPDVLDPLKTLEERLAAIPQEALVIVLSDLGIELEKEIAQKIKRSLIIVGSRDLSSMEIPTHEASSILLQGQLQGQQWGAIEIAWKPQSTAWYNLSVGRHFKDLWLKNAISKVELMKRDDNEERKSELAILESAHKDMMRFAPDNLDEKNVYDLQLVDMSVDYSKSNELTPLMEKVKKAGK